MLQVWGQNCCVPSLPGIEGHWPLILLGPVRPTSDIGVCSYCETVLAFSFLFNYFLLISYYVLGTVQGKYNVHRKSTRQLLLSMHSFTCLCPSSQPHLREVMLLDMSLLWRPRFRGDSRLPSDKVTTSPLRGSNKAGRSQGVRGPGESSNSIKLQVGWCRPGVRDQPLPSCFCPGDP